MSTPNTTPTLSEAAFPTGQPPNARRTAVKKTLFGATVLALAVLVLGYAIRVVFFQHSVVATGYLQPESVTQLNFGTSGRVAEIYVLPGDVVHAGQVLGKQDVSALQAQL